MNEIVFDIEGNSYHTIRIGNQVWMTENLKTSKFSDGTIISSLSDNYEWQNVDTPCQCLYNNNESNLHFGRIYNWFCIKRGNICPEGWRIPTVEDWKLLADNFGGLSKAGISLQDELIINLVGFRTGSFQGLGKNTFYWSTNTDESQPHLPPPGKTSKAISFKKNNNLVHISEEYQIEGFYIRCIKI